MADNEIVRPMFDCMTQTSRSIIMIKIELICIEMFNDKKVSLEPSSSMFSDDYKNIHVDTRFFLCTYFLSLKQ